MSLDVVLPPARTSTPVTRHEMVHQVRCLKKEMVVGKGWGCFRLYIKDSEGALV